MRHPSTFFIKYLMTRIHPNAGDDAWVCQSVLELGFPKPDQDCLLDIRKELTSKIPANFEPNNRYNRDSVKFMRTEGISSLHNPTDTVRKASTIIFSLKVRQEVESMLLGNLETKEVAKKINSRYKEYHTAASIEAYQHYYWNTTLMRVEDWTKALEGYDRTFQGKAQALLQVGPALALHLGGFPQQIESKMVLREMLEGVYFDYREWKMQPRSEVKTKSLAALAKAAVLIDTQLSLAESAVKDTLKSFEHFRMTHAKEKVASIEDVAAIGNFSQSGAKLLEAKREDSDARDQESPRS